MKNVLPLVMLCGCLSTSGCKDDEPSAAVASWFTTEQIEKNAALLDTAFSLTIQVMGSSDKLKKLVKGADSEKQFISEMNRLTDDVFDESIEAAWKIDSEPYRDPKYSAAHLMDHILNVQLVDPMLSYASAIEEDAASRGGHEEEIEIHGVFSYAEVLEALEGFDLIMNDSDSETAYDAIDDFYAEHHSPPLVGLLLPAIQAAREAARRTKKREQLEYVMVDILITSAQFDRLMQQQNAAGYLGALDLLASGNFKMDDDIFISIAATRAIYLNTTVQLWHQAWKAYH